MTYQPDRHHRRSIRLSEHDYSATTAYFVTICTNLAEPMFDIPTLRAILVENWEGLPRRFPGITLDVCVVMSDHMHFIIWLDGTVEKAPTLGAVVRAYKSLTAVAWLRYIEENNIIEYPGRFWQRGFYERIVRISELESKRQYIRDNPVKQKGERVREHANGSRAQASGASTPNKSTYR